MLLLYRNITAIGRLSKILWFGVMGTIGWIIFAGLTHFNAARAFDFPPGAFTISHKFLTGLGGAMLIATYDYWGYYNVSFLGDEIKDPEKNIPRALLLSILLVACLYLMMNVCILAVVPWREMMQAGQNNTGLYVVSLFMQRVYGAWAARLVTGLVIVTAFASVFSLMLGYSRVPYAAAKDGNYFKAFAKVHPVHRFPHVSLLALGVVAAAFCFLRLKDAIAALVVIRLILQFLVQAVGVIVLRFTRPEMRRPFRMWLYPLPALLAIVGFLFILFKRENWQKEMRYAVVILVTGVIIYMVRAWRDAEWPFGGVKSKGLNTGDTGEHRVELSSVNGMKVYEGFFRLADQISVPIQGAGFRRTDPAWAPLGEPLFRSLWIAAVISYTGTWMQNVGAGWLMTQLTTSPLMVSLVQAAAAIPVFLVVLPAGALADMVDRRRLLLFTQGWMVVASAALGVLTLLHAVNPWVLLVFTFLLGLGAVMNDPAWQAITPDVVSPARHASAVALNSAGFNVARAVGPALGGNCGGGGGIGMVVSGECGCRSLV